MTNREIAKTALSRTWAWSVAVDDPNDNYSEEDRAADVEAIARALDAAERRTWVEALEWCQNNLELYHDDADTLAEKLAELKAEEAKR